MVRAHLRPLARKRITSHPGMAVVGSVVLVGALAATAPASAAPSPSQTQSQACRSCVAQGVSALSTKNAWIAGFRGGPGSYSTWIRDWNGRHWHNDVTPSPGTSNELFGVDAASATDAWTVGWYYETHMAKSQLEHWDGTSWTWVPAPLDASAPLFDVSVVSSNDAWAVGNYVSDVGQRTLILHWDGSSWTQVPSPNPSGATSITLRKVSADSATDAWALGQYKIAGAGRVADNGIRSYMLHWNGASWTEVSTVTQNLQDVSATSPTDAWAVGAQSGNTVTEHWNGVSWSRVSSPNPGPGPSRVLEGVDARTSTDVWATGFYDDITGGESAVIMHWDGVSWTDVGAPAPANSYLAGVSASASNDAWAIGDTTGSGKAHLLLEHWDGSSWTEQ